MAVLSAEGIEFEFSVPVVIVGGGAAGMVAALACSDAGVSPLVLERDRVPRGSTGLSSGMVPACGTQLQAKNGVDDSVAILAGDISAKARGHVDKTLVEAICRISGPTIDWLIKDHNIELTLVGGFLYPGHSRLRMHAPPSRQGVDLIGALTNAAEEAGIDIMTEAHVRDLYADGAKISGLRMERPDGTVEMIGCQSVILACNGYGGNPDMIRRYIPEMAEANYFGHPGNQGDAVLWGQDLGATTLNLGAYQGHGSVAHPHGILITWALMMEGGIQVNIEGKRFSNEHEGYSEQGKRVMSQDQGLAWNIYDRRIHKLGVEFEDYRQAEKMGAVLIADTAEDLAVKLGLPAKSLSETVDDCRQFATHETTDPQGRNFQQQPPLSPPFYGIKVTGSLFHTQGGLAINEQARVLMESGSEFPNLYAAGGAATGISGPADWGYLSGNGLLSAVSLGRLAGQTAADQIRSNRNN